ncbi:hypothetical protein CTI12_AA529830 [Artemisia annua]|uniref:BED-type domain-containing protein n=1 Tax=Artemisia annua TaxID=35608 RepID=A0A2U1L4Y8_ARTAN|nr:hypothetical protein CTI12_AA529830 [Artemisia annua]
MKKSSAASTPSSSSVPSANSRCRRSNAAGARTDVAWEYEIEVGYRRVKCRYCNKECTGGMFRFKHHLTRTHQNVTACPNVPEEVKVKIQNILEQNELASKKRKGVLTIDEVHSKRRNRLQQEKMNDLVYVMYNLKLSGREERKRKEEDFGVEQPETFEDVDSDDEWITEDNEDLTNMYANESKTDGASGDDDFLEHALRNQYGSNEKSGEESNYVFEEGNEVVAVDQLEIID